MPTLINIPADSYTHEQVVFTSGGVNQFASACYAPSTGIGRGQHARVVFMYLETADIRFKVNGSSPAANCGMIYVKDNYLTLESPNDIRNFRGITTAGGVVSTAVVFYYF